MKRIIGSTLAALAIALAFPVISAQATPVINSETNGTFNGSTFSSGVGTDINYDIGNPGGAGEIFTIVVFVTTDTYAEVTSPRMTEGWFYQTIGGIGAWNATISSDGCIVCSGGPSSGNLAYSWAQLFAPVSGLATGFLNNGYVGLGFFLAAQDPNLAPGFTLPDFTKRFTLLNSNATIGPNTSKDGFIGFNQVFAQSPALFASLNPQGGSPIITTFDVPEPGTLALFAFGLLGFGAMRRRRRA